MRSPSHEVLVVGNDDTDHAGPAERAAVLGGALRPLRSIDLGGTLAVLGALIAIGDVMSQLMTWQMADKSADRVQMAALLERFDTAPGAGIVFTVGGLAVLVGTVLLGIGLVRGRLAPAWSGVGLALAVVVNVAGFGAASNALVAVSWAILLVAMGSIGRTALAGGARLAPDAAAPMRTHAQRLASTAVARGR
jgi:hypothetical protein